MADAGGPLPRWLAPATWLLARGYGAGVSWRNARFDRGGGVRRLEVAGARVPVISVGNLTAGGTGKSPFVAWVCAELARDGVEPVIAMRGYGAYHPGDSDEALEYATTAPGARRVVDPDRTRALQAELLRIAPAELARCVVVLDDGFQHRQLARDLDIVLVDATRPALDGDLLPNGWLREPARNIARADLVVLTKAHDETQRAHAAALVARVRGKPHDAACEHAWRGLAVHAREGARTEPVGWLAGKRVLSACALGNPRHFHDMVARATGVAPVEFTRADHAAMPAAELESAAARAGVECIVTSRKDFVKLGRGLACAVAVPELAISFLEGEERVRAALAASARAPTAPAARSSS